MMNHQDPSGDRDLRAVSRLHADLHWRCTSPVMNTVLMEEILNNFRQLHHQKNSGHAE